jgi:hypothetical protein
MCVGDSLLELGGGGEGGCGEGGEDGSGVDWRPTIGGRGGGGGGGSYPEIMS